MERPSIGLIAGRGQLPLLIAADARSRGFGVVAVGLEGLADESLAAHVDAIEWLNAGKLGAVIKFFKSHSITQAVMGGKVPKTILFDGGFVPDLKAVSTLMRLRDMRDDSIIGAVAGVFKDEGIEFLDMKEFCRGLLTPEGKLTKRGPTKDESRDIEFGFRMAKEIGALDIGQTVVVKDRAVMAVEAIEGTDAAIRRGGALAGEGGVVVKVSRPKQDMRFDVPVVGPDTLKVMIEARIRVLALEAGKSIFLDRAAFVAGAQEAGICVIGVRGEGL